VDCSGKTVIVTGANIGLGKAAAGHFVSLNADKVIIACRSVEKGEAARAEILKSSGRPESAIEVWPLDLSKYDSIREFAKRVTGLKRLDIVVENAGELEEHGALLCRV
jgi:NAD(P)-dependent dehydrogenase (short-subunit alcohol dehydrogenase family)